LEVVMIRDRFARQRIAHESPANHFPQYLFVKQ